MRKTFIFTDVSGISTRTLIVVFFFPGATGRITNPCEKLLQQVEPVNSNLKAKKLRLDESLSDGFITVLPKHWMQYDSPKQESVWILSLFLSWLSQPVILFLFLPPCSPLSSLCLWGGERGSVSLRPEESWSEESPRWWRRAEGSRCWTPPSPLPLSLSYSVEQLLNNITLNISGLSLWTRQTLKIFPHFYHQISESCSVI